MESHQVSYPKICPPTSQDISYIHTQGFHKAQPDKPSPRQQPKQGFGNYQIKGVPNISNDHHASSYASKNLHVKFQALQVKFPQTIAQMVENQLYWTKSQLWSTYSQTS